MNENIPALTETLEERKMTQSSVEEPDNELKITSEETKLAENSFLPSDPRLTSIINDASYNNIKTAQGFTEKPESKPHILEKHDYQQETEKIAEIFQLNPEKNIEKEEIHDEEFSELKKFSDQSETDLLAKIPLKSDSEEPKPGELLTNVVYDQSHKTFERIKSDDENEKRKSIEDGGVYEKVFEKFEKNDAENENYSFKPGFAVENIGGIENLPERKSDKNRSDDEFDIKSNNDDKDRDEFLIKDNDSEDEYLENDFEIENHPAEEKKIDQPIENNFVIEKKLENDSVIEKKIDHPIENDFVIEKKLENDSVIEKKIDHPIENEFVIEKKIENGSVTDQKIPTDPFIDQKIPTDSFIDQKIEIKFLTQKENASEKGTKQDHELGQNIKNQVPEITHSKIPDPQELESKLLFDKKVEAKAPQFEKEENSYNIPKSSEIPKTTELKNEPGFDHAKENLSNGSGSPNKSFEIDEEDEMF